MPRKKHKVSKEQVVRLGLQLSGRAKKSLEELQRKTDAVSASEVVRRALAVYERVVERTIDHDCSVVLKYPNGAEEILVLVEIPTKK